MPHDSKGLPLAKGDEVLIRAVVLDFTGEQYQDTRIVVTAVASKLSKCYEIHSGCLEKIIRKDPAKVHADKLKEYGLTGRKS
jgi:hypothetical protein